MSVIYLKIFQNVIYDAKLNFQHHYSRIQCHMILWKTLIW